MLTDIFATRYADVKIWEQFTTSENRLIVQSFRIVSEQICPYYIGGKESPAGKAYWTTLHDRISMELGLKSLSPVAYAYQTTWNGNPHTVSGVWTIDTVCENWMLKPFDGQVSADEFVKERLSLVELAFRQKSEHIAEANAQLPAAVRDADIRWSRKTGPGIVVPGKLSDSLKAANANANEQYQNTIQELNARFVQAGSKLNYHNGFIQFSEDGLVALHIETPFWDLVPSPKWKNVDADMKEALDRRDTGARDPASTLCAPWRARSR